MDRNRSGMGISFVTVMLLARLVFEILGAHSSHPDLAPIDRSLFDQFPAPSIDLSPATVPMIGPDGQLIVTIH